MGTLQVPDALISLYSFMPTLKHNYSTSKKTIQPITKPRTNMQKQTSNRSGRMNDNLPNL